MFFMPSICFASRTADSLLINQIWDFSRNYSEPVNGIEQNLYLRYTFGSERRNPTLYLVPTMYTIAKGERNFIGESYCRIKYRTPSDYDLHRQVVCGTIPHNRFTMSAMVHYITPNLYDISIYPEAFCHRSIVQIVGIINTACYKGGAIGLSSVSAHVSTTPNLLLEMLPST